MNTLILDTTTNVEIIMVQRGDVIANCTEQVMMSHSISIFKNLEHCLSKLDLAIKDINLVCVGIGPGSFTGIRIAVTTARMFAQILNVPLIGVKTQELFAASFDKADKGDNIMVCFDAKKGRVFGGLYKKESGLVPSEIVPPGDYFIEELMEKIDKNHKTWAAGDGIKKYYTTISEKINNLTFIEAFRPHSEAIFTLLKNRFKDNPDLYRDINRVVPFYSRKSDAEVAREKM